MTAERSRPPRYGNLKWSDLRADTAPFATIADCAQYCLPGLRACAGVLFGSQSGGDDLIEAFLNDILCQAAPGERLKCPAGLTEAFEAFLRAHFTGQPQRIALSSGPERVYGVWMSVDEFLDAIARL